MKKLFQNHVLIGLILVAHGAWSLDKEQEVEEATIEHDKKRASAAMLHVLQPSFESTYRDGLHSRESFFKKRFTPYWLIAIPYQGKVKG